ncbi:hypothetical protein JI752_001330 [Lysobacter sp. MMG2]|uniref:hypothetical protein n=1 Tax=Lysobacter sp. MMG2 TaxID=2801338 RepID=UPI001C218BAF|nr:hypothetical protein [Lysobacter sp. MMG2]MBU8974773.1 hypothetical protein [Lysobacter sp. MMG2]
MAAESSTAEVWNVFVTAASAVAVFYLGWKANQLGQSANAIEKQTQERADSAERREGHVLLITLQPEIDNTLKKAQLLYDQEANELAPTFYAAHQNVRSSLAMALAGMQLSAVEKNMARLHVPGSPLAEAIAKAAGLHRLALLEANHASHPDNATLMSNDQREEAHLTITRALLGMVDNLSKASLAARSALQ